MQDLSGLCLFCMQPLDENSECEHCKDKRQTLQKSPFLIAGTVLSQRYYIGALRSSNGEGATYVAYDTKLSRPCMVREFFPESVCSRYDDGVSVLPEGGSEPIFEDCLKNFVKLWTRLQRFKGLTSAICVYDVQQTNGTAYGIYSDMEDLTLREWLLSNGKGYISWEQARILFMPMLSTLLTLHTTGIFHRGISPSTILVTKDEKLKLSDFCIGEARTVYGDLPPQIDDGFAAPEIYAEDGVTGAWTDIYSFTAVLFRTLIGSTPIASPIRLQNDQMMIPAKFAEQLPPYVINALINGMQLDENDRTHTAEQLRSNLSASPRAVQASADIYGASSDPVTAFPSSAAKNPYVPPVQKPITPLSDEDDEDGIFAEDETPAPQKPARKREVQPEQPVKNREAADRIMEQEKKQKILKIILGVVIGILILGIILVVPELYKTIQNPEHKQTPDETTVQQTATVIDFTKNHTYTELTSDEYYSSLFTFKKTEAYSDTVPAGTVMAQDVPAGSVVPLKTCILLTVSAGAKTVIIPDLTNKTYEEALAVLSGEGIVCTKNTKYNDGTHKANTVAETFPPAGTSVKSTDTVSIVLWATVDETTIPQESTQADSQATTLYPEGQAPTPQATMPQ